MRGIIICVLVFAAGAAYAQTDQNNPPAQSVEAGDSQTESSYRNFSGGQRIGTWALNNFVFPGLGSFLIMHDVLGGAIHLVLGGAGMGLTITGTVLIFRHVYGFVVTDQWGAEGTFRKSFNTYVAMIITGGVMTLGDFIFNIVRSAAYNKPRPKTASVIDPNAWSVAVLPGENGAGQVQLAYTVRL